MLVPFWGSAPQTTNYKLYTLNHLRFFLALVYQKLQACVFMRNVKHALVNLGKLVREVDNLVNKPVF